MTITTSKPSEVTPVTKMRKATGVRRLVLAIRARWRGSA